MDYFLGLAGVVIKITLLSNLMLGESWKNFIKKNWGKNLLIKRNKKADIKIRINGPRLILGEVKGLSKKDKVELPLVKSEGFDFNNLLNFNFFIFCLRLSMTEYLERKKNMLIIHASGFVHRGKAVLVSGPSGSGKSTIIKELGDMKGRCLGDDFIIVKIGKRKIWAYLSPLNNKLEAEKYIKTGRPYEIGAILTVKKKGKMGLRKLTTKEQWNLVINQLISRLNNKMRGRSAMDLFKLMTGRCFEIRYNIGDPVFNLIEKLKI